MPVILLDTHAIAWAMLEDAQLSAAARQAMLTADQSLVSPASLYEIAQKVRLGKWPALAARSEAMPDEILRNGFAFAPMTADICLLAGRADWPHRDPFDRLIAATALTLGVPLVTRDPVFAGLPGLRCIW
jgi:PIN domain nuclease of toxin-antitoxin system